MRKCSFCGAEINDIKHKKYKDICVDECSKNSLFEQLDDSIEICPSCKVVSADLSKYSDIPELGRIQKEKLDSNADYQNVANDNNLDNSIYQAKLEGKRYLLTHSSLSNTKGILLVGECIYEILKNNSV